MTSGRRLRAVAERRPAQLVAFDVLAADGKDLRSKPLRDRRRVLERALSGLASPIVLCQQTTDLAVAEEWFRTLTVADIEGVVVKDAAGTYPTRDGQRVWWKVKAQAGLDMVAIGYTGTAAAPGTLVLAFPGDVDDAGELPTVGSTTVLTKAAARAVAPLLRPTGASFEAPSRGVDLAEHSDRHRACGGRGVSGSVGRDRRLASRRSPAPCPAGSISRRRRTRVARSSKRPHSGTWCSALA